MMTIAFRPACAQDRADVLALCAKIWDGHDYIPGVWEAWLADPRGQFTVVMDESGGGKLIGLGKLTLSVSGDSSEWWLEGLRLDPAYQGRGLGSQLHDYHVNLWRRLGGPGCLRLLTDSKNSSVQHLCERTGFRRLSHLTVFEAEALTTVTSGTLAVSDLVPARPGAAFRTAAPPESEAVFALAVSGHFYRTHHRLFCQDQLWKWVELSAAWVEQLAGQGEVWIWGDGRGMLIGEECLAGDSPLNDQPCLFVNFAGAGRSGTKRDEREAPGTDAPEGERGVACPRLERKGVPSHDDSAGRDSLAGLLYDARQLAADLHKPLVGLPVPVDDSLAIDALTQAGYHRAWEGSFYLYEVCQ